MTRTVPEKSGMSNVTVQNGYISKFTANNFTPEVVNETIHRVVNTYLIGANIVQAYENGRCDAYTTDLSSLLAVQVSSLCMTCLWVYWQGSTSTWQTITPCSRTS